eukprot:1505028-Rhodomonas_salina.1
MGCDRALISALLAFASSSLSFSCPQHGPRQREPKGAKTNPLPGSPLISAPTHDPPGSRLISAPTRTCSQGRGSCEGGQYPLGKGWRRGGWRQGRGGGGRGRGRGRGGGRRGEVAAALPHPPLRPLLEHSLRTRAPRASRRACVCGCSFGGVGSRE